MRTVTQARNYVVPSHCHDIAALIFDLKLHTKQGKTFLLKKDINKSANTVSYLYDPPVFMLQFKQYPKIKQMQ
jgi:hypothetical protein